MVAGPLPVKQEKCGSWLVTVPVMAVEKQLGSIVQRGRK